MSDVLTNILYLVAGAIISFAITLFFLMPGPILVFDSNKDGAISYAEFRAANSAIFEIADRDGNGYFSVKESKLLAQEGSGNDIGASVAAWLNFKMIDPNRDGKISWEEARNPKVMKEVFSVLDKDGSGAVSIDELKGRAAAAIFLR